MSKRYLFSTLIGGTTALAASVVLALLAAASPTFVEAAHANAPSGGCGAVSCTVYFPLAMRNYPQSPQIEVTQAVQQPDNSVLLIANRPTFARLTITSTVAHTNVRAWLYATRNGDPLPGSPIAALNNPRTLRSTANRSTLDDTFNFQLPASWLGGDISLSAYATNSTTFVYQSGARVFQLVQGNPLNVTVVPIVYTCTSGGSGTTTPVGPYTYLTTYTYRIYPIPLLSVTARKSVSYRGPCLDGVPDPGDYDWSAMLDAVTDVWAADGYPDSYYYGLVHVYCENGCTSGLGWIGQHKAAVGFDGLDAAHTEASETHAHEVGHNHGRYHAPGCGADYPDKSFPYVSGGRGYIGNSTRPNYGFNTATQTIYPYASTYDIMSYCGPVWISDYTYRTLWEYAQTQSASSDLKPKFCNE